MLFSIHSRNQGLFLKNDGSTPFSFLYSSINDLLFAAISAVIFSTDNVRRPFFTEISRTSYLPYKVGYYSSAAFSFSNTFSSPLVTHTMLSFTH